MMAIFAIGIPNAGEAAAQSLTPSAEETVDKLSVIKRPEVAWLRLQECIGCIESVLRPGGTTAEDVVLNLVSMDYNELFMAPSGHAAEKASDDMNAKDHTLVIDGSIPTGENGAYCIIGGKSAEQVLFEAAEKATAILTVGACVAWGPVQAAKLNLAGAKGVDEITKDKPVINVSGCPPTGEVIMAALTYVLTYGKASEVDAEGCPKFAYDQRIHNSCPRRAHFDAGQSVKTFDDEGVRNGWYLYEVGCKGPSTFSPCLIVQWNLRPGWPTGVGYPCIGCTGKDFLDQFTPFYDKLPGIPGVGVESSVNKVGAGLLAATAASVAVHGGLTLAKELKTRRSNGEEKVLAASGGVEGRKPPMVDLSPNSSGAQSETAPDSKDN